MLMIRRLGATIALVAAAATPLAGNAQPRCSHETLAVNGTAVTVAYCIQTEPRANSSLELIVPVQESFSAPSGSFGRFSQLHFVAGEGASRILEPVDLAPLGLEGTLHLTLIYAEGLIQIEGAFLTPGAIKIK